MRKLFYILFILAIVLGCAKPPKVTLANSNETRSIAHVDLLTIEAKDLSEDLSRLSTQNDEIIVLIYDFQDSMRLGKPLYAEKLIFDKDTLKRTLAFDRKKQTILFLIEEDSYRNVEQIEPVVRIYFKEIMAANGYQERKKYLGEDDLLGFKIFNENTSKFELKGVTSLDSYRYLLSFE